MNQASKSTALGDCRDPVPPDILYALSPVESEATRMTGLVEDLLLLARLDAGRPLEDREVDLSALVVDAVSDAHATDGEHNRALDLSGEALSVRGDEERLHQVMVNLLANARTHTPPGTTVVTDISTGPRFVEVRVTDDGPGIPPEVLQRVFERFARGDTSRARTAGSTGLGLAIVQAVVSAHHGTVEAARAPGAHVVHRPASVAAGFTARPQSEHIGHSTTTEIVGS